MMDTQEIGTLIKEKRLEKGLAQQELAALLHVTSAAVSKWENGHNLPDIQNMGLLSKALDIPLAELIPADMLPVLSESASDTGKSDADDEPPAMPVPDAPIPLEPETASSDRSAKNSRRKFIIVSLLCIFLAGLAAIACWMIFHEKAPSFTVVEEYYGDYEGQKAYYILVEYTGEPRDDDYSQNDESFRISHVNYFEDAAFIIIVYYDEGRYDKAASDPLVAASAYAILYPRPSFDTLKGDDS